MMKAEVYTNQWGLPAWRLFIVGLLVGAAKLIAPIEIDWLGDPSKPMEFYCPNCWNDNGHVERKSFMARFAPGWGFGVVLCPDCNKQWCIVRTGKTARIIEDPPSCDYACEYTDSYGFVAECGCPTHDPGGRMDKLIAGLPYVVACLGQKGA